MARVLVEKQVLFSGIWRPRHLDDEFLRTVSREFAQKPSAQATWRLSTEGVIVLVSQSASGKVGQTDLIPITSIREVTVNRYNPLCLMTLFVDPNRRFNALICRCQSEKDSADIVHVYRDLRKSVSGEGYRIDLKQPQGINWTLKNSQNGGQQRDLNANVTTDVINGHGPGNAPSRQSSMRSQGGSAEAPVVGVFAAGRPGERVLVEVEEEKLEREPLRTEEGLQGFNVGVQAELGDHDSDIESSASDMSLQSLKDELYSLSTEVREIKKLLAKSQGISTEEYFRREQDGPRSSSLVVPVKRSVSQDSNSHSSGEKRVNFASDSEAMEFDIRSVGMQTDRSRVQYVKRARGGTAPARYKQAPFRPRANSNASSQATANTAMVSPATSYDANLFAYTNHGHRIVHLRQGDPRQAGGSVPTGGTLMRPIESVYHTGSRHKRGQIIVMPQRAATIGPVRTSVQKSFQPEASRPPTGNGVHFKTAHAPATDAGDGAKPKAAGNGIVPGGRAPVASQ